MARLMLSRTSIWGLGPGNHIHHLIDKLECPAFHTLIYPCPITQRPRNLRRNEQKTYQKYGFWLSKRYMEYGGFMGFQIIFSGTYLCRPIKNMKFYRLWVMPAMNYDRLDCM